MLAASGSYRRSSSVCICLVLEGGGEPVAGHRAPLFRGETQKEPPAQSLLSASLRLSLWTLLNRQKGRQGCFRIGARFPLGAWTALEGPVSGKALPGLSESGV